MSGIGRTFYLTSISSEKDFLSFSSDGLLSKPPKVLRTLFRASCPHYRFPEDSKALANKKTAKNFQ